MTAKPGVLYTRNLSDPTVWSAPGREDLISPIEEWVPPTPVTAGSLPIGSSVYELPTSNVLYVSPSGNNSNSGTISSPKQTLAGAVSAASSGYSIVLRAGTYHESITMPSNKVLTIQAHPGEAVWLDGSSVYSSWTGSGPWISTLGPDWSPTSTDGFPLTTDPYGNLPEQVWIDGVAQRQIADSSTPAAGQFSVNRTANTISIGTNPSGKEVRVADLSYALTLTARCDLYGIGVRRYSPLNQEGLNALLYYGGTSQGSIIENCVLQESHLVALNTARAITIRNVTVQDCGNSGIQVTTADGFVIERFVIRRCNRGLWKGQPHTSGIKITRTEGMLAKDGLIYDVPAVIGFWLDVSVTKSIVSNVDVDGSTTVPGAENGDLAFHSELSDGGFYDDVQHRSWFVNCRSRNTKFGIKFLAAGWTNIANCRFESYSSVGIYLQQDERRNTGQPGNLDPSVCPWVGYNTGILNNDIAQGGLQVIAYHDPPEGDPLMLGWDFIDRIAGNWFRPAPPGSMVQLGKADGFRNSYNSLAALASSPSTVGVVGSKLGTNHQGTTAPSDSIADTLPAEICTVLGIPTDLERVGPFLPSPVASF